MNLIKYPDDIIKKWDKQVQNLMMYKLRENQFISCVYWYLQKLLKNLILIKRLINNLSTIKLP